jgi:hypothetical protein
LSSTNLHLLYAAVSALELYFFLMQRASLEVSRASDIHPKIGRHMLPLWYSVVWPIKIARWVLLYFIWSASGWVALGVAWAIPFAISIFTPVPFRHFLHIFHVKIARDVARIMTGNAHAGEGEHAIQLLGVINSAEKRREGVIRQARYSPSQTPGKNLMAHTDQIKELATIVNDGLKGYIAIHNTVFWETTTFKSFLKNLFGLGVPMSKLLEDSEGLLPLWDVIHQKMEVFRKSAYSTLSKDEKYYFDILSRYVDTVRKTVTALIDRQRLMNEGSKGGTMTREAFQQKGVSYRIAVQEYTAIGQELNDAAPIIFG